VVYGRNDRPTVLVPVVGQWVRCEVLRKTRDASGTWWVTVSYIHPSTLAEVEERLPVDGLSPGG